MRNMRNTIKICATVALLGLTVLLSGFRTHFATLTPNVDHPVLWFDKAALNIVKRNIKEYDWMNKLFQGMRRQADEAIKLPIDIPEDGGLHSSEAFPEGRRVIQLSQTEYYSEADGKIYSGRTEVRGQGKVILRNFPYKQVFDYTKHGILASRAKLLAFVYAVTGERIYAEKAREILVGYARNFSENKYPLHKYDGSIYEPDEVPPHAGRVLISASEDAIWTYDMMCVYDWTYNSGLYSSEDQNLVEQMFTIQFHTIMRDLLGNTSGITNQTAAENLARAVYGILTGNAELVKEAITGKKGFIEHLSVMNSDGRLEHHGIGYHFAFMHWLVYTAEILNRAGFGDLFSYDSSKLKKGVDFLIHSTYLDGLRIPQIQTAVSEWNWTPAFSSVFESAYSRYLDDIYLIPLLSDLKFLSESDLESHLARWGRDVTRGTYTSMGGGRTYVEGLLMARPEVPPKPPIISLPSMHLRDSKYIFLRTGDSKNGIGVFITYENKSALHSDMGSFQFFAFGRELGRESGMSSSYLTEDFAAWYSQRVAHNVVVVDQYSPGLPPNYRRAGPSLSSIGSAEVTLYDPNPNRPRAVLEADGTIYPSVKMTRDISIWNGAVHVIDTLRSSNTHSYDWVYRNEGEIVDVTGVRLEPWDGELGTDYGYQRKWIFNIRRGITSSSIKVRWIVPPSPFDDRKVAVELEVQAAPNTEVILADAFWEKRKRIGPILLIRRVANETTYVVSIKSYAFDN